MSANFKFTVGLVAAVLIVAGCHSYFVAEVISLADGRRLGAADYFAKDKLDALGQLA